MKKQLQCMLALAHLHVRHSQVAGVMSPPVVTVGLQHHAHVACLLCSPVALDQAVTTQPLDAVMRDRHTCTVAPAAVTPHACVCRPPAVLATYNSWRQLLQAAGPLAELTPQLLLCARVPGKHTYAAGCRCNALQARQGRSSARVPHVPALLIIAHVAAHLRRN